MSDDTGGTSLSGAGGPTSKQLGRGVRAGTLLAIILLAAALRLADPSGSLPGLQIDEASNVWNAYCLLRTGCDEWGERWPVFRTRAFDDYRSPMYLYALIPFQAVGGMSVATARMPAALGGVITVALVYYLGRRMFDDGVGLVAAALLAVCPWDVQHTRWGHEGTIGPLLVAMSIAALLWAGAPLVNPLDTRTRMPPRWWRGLLAGLICGLACYGYAAVRIHLPLVLLAAVAANWRGWMTMLRSRRSRGAVVGMAGGFLLLFAPLALKHATDPLMNRRTQELALRKPGDVWCSPGATVSTRYARHFSARWLFVGAGNDPVITPPPGYGQFYWYTMPLLIGGAIVALRQCPKSPAARFLLAMVLLYPLSDVIFATSQPNAIRCFPGIVGLVLLAGLGGADLARWLGRIRRWMKMAFSGAMLAWAGVSTASFLLTFFGPFNAERAKYQFRHVDMLEACRWLEPRVGSADAIYVTQKGTLFPHVLTLTYLRYDPARWFAEPRSYAAGPYPFEDKQVCTGYGKFHFLYELPKARQELDAMRSNGRPDHVLMVLRVGEERELGLTQQPAAVLEFADRTWLVLYDVEL